MTVNKIDVILMFVAQFITDRKFNRLSRSYPSLNPSSQAPFFTLSALTERLPRSPDPIVNQKSALCGPIHNLKIHRHKPAQGESKTLTQLYQFTL